MSKDEIDEAKIRWYEALLKRYTELSDQSGIGKHSQEETADRILDTLNELYKKRKKQ